MKLHSLKGYIQNIHLVEYSHGCILLDGCCRSDFPLILDFFENTLKRPINDLKVVMVTHMHPDHAGCANKLKKASGCKLISGDYKKQWYCGISGWFAHKVDIILALWVAKRMGKKKRNLWYNRKLKADLLLKDNQQVPEFEDWRIITTPGHTSIDISLVNDSAKLIYVADLIVSVRGELVAPYPVFFPVLYKESLKKLRNFAGFKVLLAHVKPFCIDATQINQLITKAPMTPQTNIQAVKQKVLRISN